MNKNELVEAVAKHTAGTKADATRAIEAVFTVITNQLKAGQEVRLVGVGTFAVTKRKATTGRNPRTGAAIKIPASKQVKFRPGKQMKDAVNK